MYVRPFPGPGGKWQISDRGGENPAWPASGRELLYQSADRHIMAVEYTVKGETFIAGKPRQWAERRVPANPNGFGMWDIAPDGKRIAAVLPSGRDEAAEPKEPTHLNFLINFADELERRRVEP